MMIHGQDIKQIENDSPGYTTHALGLHPRARDGIQCMKGISWATMFYTYNIMYTLHVYTYKHHNDAIGT
jgi:hypothetical protein